MSETSDDSEAQQPTGERFSLAIPSDLVPSPCQGLCVVDEAGALCVGCFRTLHEIGGWGGYSATQKREVLELVDGRQKAYEAVSKSEVGPVAEGLARELNPLHPSGKPSTEASATPLGPAPHHTIKGRVDVSKPLLDKSLRGETGSAEPGSQGKP